jgi:hypothetical protein
MNPAGGRLCAGELGQRVAQEGNGDHGGDDGQRRRHARGDGQEPEAEIKAHRRADVGHGGGRDVHDPEHAPVQPVRFSRGFKERDLAFAERQGSRAHRRLRVSGT